MPWFDHPDNPSDPRAAILLTFLAGIILLGMAVFKLGFLERVLKLSNFFIQYNLYLSFKWGLPSLSLITTFFTLNR